MAEDGYLIADAGDLPHVGGSDDNGAAAVGKGAQERMNLRPSSNIYTLRGFLEYKRGYPGVEELR